MLSVQMFCEVVLSIYDQVEQILNHPSVRLIRRGKRDPITQIRMNVSPSGEITNPLGIDFEGRLGIKVQARAWITERRDRGGKYLRHYSQNVSDLRGRKLQPLYVNGEFAIFSYQKVALVRSCYETNSIRIITLHLDGNTVKAEEVLPWMNSGAEWIKTEADQERFLKDFVLKGQQKSQYIDAAIDGLSWAARTVHGDRRPTFFLTREEVAMAATT